MAPSPRLIATVATPLALLAAASVASAGLLATPSYLNDQKVYPAVVDTDGSSYVDVAVRWAPHLLRRAGSSDVMKVTLTGRGRKGAPIRFARRTLRHHGPGIEVVRLRVPKRQRGAYVNARSVVASAVHHWDSPADTDALSNLVAVGNADVKGTVRRSAYSGRLLRDCDVATLGPTSVATGCDFRGADLSGADLSRANLAGSVFDQGNLAGAALTNANVTATSMVGANIAGTDFGPLSQAAYTLPQAANPGQGKNAACAAGGGVICDSVYSAQHTVDAVFYQFAGPNVTRWLQDAIRRGVDVRVIINSANTTPGSATPALCQSVSATDPQCAWSPKADPFYALEAQLKSVVGPGTGTARVQFSSQNFNITHQKTIIIDGAVGSNEPGSPAGAPGTPKTPEQLPASARAYVSTGNLMAYPNSWGQRTIGTKVVNPDYLTNPAASCTGGTAAGCDLEWTPRDFALVVASEGGTAPGTTDRGKQVLSRIAGVFASDFRCDGPSVTNVGTLVPDPAAVYPSNAATADWPETWSNGSVYAGDDTPPAGSALGQYPQAGLSPFGYFSDSYVDGLVGNVRARQIALIKAADTSLVVYNEEMSDIKKPSVPKGTTWDPTTVPVDSSAPYIANQLIGAAQRGVKVTIVMANNYANGSPTRTGTSWAQSFDAILSKANYPASKYPKAIVPTISLLPEDGGLYIHAKAIVADATDGWFGSTNASTPSMNDNRELGMGVTNRTSDATAPIPGLYSPQMVAGILSAASSDAAQGKPWPMPTGAPRYVSAGSYASSAQFPCINVQANAQSGLPARDPANPQAPPQAVPGP